MARNGVRACNRFAVALLLHAMPVGRGRGCGSQRSSTSAIGSPQHASNRYAIVWHSQQNVADMPKKLLPRKKNILIFSDGTGQAGGISVDERRSNIYKLYRATRVGPDSIIKPAEQVAYYDAGVCTENLIRID